MRSLNARLGSGLLIALLTVFILQWLLISVIIRNVTEDYIVTRLTRDSRELLGALEFDTGDRPFLDGGPPGLYDSGPFSGQYFQIRVNGETLRSESIWDRDLPMPEVAAGEAVRQRLPGPLEQTLLEISRGYVKQGQKVIISVAEDISAVDAGIARFQRYYLLFSLGMMLLLLLCQWWIVRRSLRALTASRLDLERVYRGETEQLPENAPAEIQPLIKEINRLLALLARRLQRTRTAVGDLAHKLKTPLSLIAQLGNDPAVRDHPRIRERLQEQAAVMRNTLDRELGRARLAGDGGSGRRFVPAGDLSSLAMTLESIYKEKNIIIERDIEPDVVWQAEREDMLELFGNLLDNACKWSRGRVRIVCGKNDAVIEDDGPGCSPEEIALLGDRGRRLDETVDGHGLGLAIAGDIVNFYQGRMEFDQSPDLGGLRVRVTLAD